LYENVRHVGTGELREAAPNLHFVPHRPVTRGWERADDLRTSAKGPLSQVKESIPVRNKIKIVSSH